MDPMKSHHCAKEEREGTRKECVITVSPMDLMESHHCVKEKREGKQNRMSFSWGMGVLLRWGGWDKGIG